MATESSDEMSEALSPTWALVAGRGQRERARPSPLTLGASEKQENAGLHVSRLARLLGCSVMLMALRKGAEWINRRSTWVNAS